jgi:transcriptional regulator with XRE-family HTH domain
MDRKTFLLALGQEIAVARRRHVPRMTQGELAAKSGVNKRQVGRIERGESPGQTDQLWAMADALGVELSVLVEAAETEARKAN